MPVANPYLKSNKKRQRPDTEGTDYVVSSPSGSNSSSVRAQNIQPPNQLQVREVKAMTCVQRTNPYAKSKPAVPEHLCNQLSDNRVPSSNHHTPPASTHEKQLHETMDLLNNDHLPSTVPASLPLQTQTSLQKTTLQDFDPSFDDSGIDWDAAIQIMDQTANRRVSPVSNSLPTPSSLASTSLVTRPSAIDDIRTTSNPHTSRSLSHPQESQRPNMNHTETSKSRQGLELPSKWTTNASKVPPILQFSMDRVKPVNDEHRQALVQNANLSATLNNGWKLYSHQKRAILKALLMRRCILALDCGLGKTIIGCVWAKSMQRTYGDLKVYVICPVSMTQEWKRTAQDATGLIVAGDKADKENAVKCDMQICSWGKVPIDVPRSIPNFVVVCDEAHSMQSMLAQRTQSVLQLIQSPRCVGVLLLSGTPMKNGKPSNLFPLLKAVNHPFGDNQKSFETYFCAGHQKQMRGTVVWDANGSSNLSDLNQHISSHLLYLRKDDVLSDLPPQTRTTRQVPVSSRHQLQHNQALADLARLYSSSSSSLEKSGSGDVVLTAVQKVRMIGSYAKIDATVGLAKEVLQHQPAIVIFTSFAQVAKDVHQQLSDSGWEGCLLTGETPSKQRQGLVDAFQQGLRPVFVSTFGAGGVGLTLTAAHTIILLDRPWTPGEAQQAEDRIRRIGQMKPVTSIWMTAFDLDQQIDDLLAQKKLTSDAVLTTIHQDHPASVCHHDGAPKLSIFQLLRSVLNPNVVGNF